ncbi:MAG TPA: PCRF domain-containing protein, partial [Stellaceae bacterium]|nr:PCRF domain-containing protein [Stellaceae bacterium]
KLRHQRAELEEQASAPDLWDDQAHAQEVNSRLSYVSGEISRLERLRSRLDDAALMLEMAEDNTAAAALYAAHGFVPIGRRPRYYRRGRHFVDALVLRLRLAKSPHST